MLHKYAVWRRTRPGSIISVILALIVTYVFASFAIDSGSLLQYFIAIVFLVEAIISFINIFRVQQKVTHDQTRKSKRTA